MFVFMHKLFVKIQDLAQIKFFLRDKIFERKEFWKAKKYLM